MNYTNLLEIATFTPRSLQSPGSWVGHLPFAAWVMQEVRPRIFVELGTHSGNSYFAFCQSVVEAGLVAQCFAVDTWRGDDHSGLYSDEIFLQVSEYNDKYFSNFSQLMRMTFDAAASYFLDNSIELLHIDGLHTYEAVKHDFETWLPKLTPSAVVMFHDTNVRERDFGVWRFWEELKLEYPYHFECLHSHGLGVLQLKSASVEEKIKWLDPDSTEKHMLMQYFTALGSRQTERLELAQLKGQVEKFNQNIADHDQQVTVLTQTVAERDRQITVLTQTIAKRDEQINSLKAEASVIDGHFRQHQQEQERKIDQLYHSISRNTFIKIGSQLNRISLWKWYDYHNLKKATNNHPLFDTQWYLSQYPDVKLLKSSALKHYFFFGAEEGRNPNPYFDTRWYLKEYFDVVMAGINPLLHFIKYGVSDGRDPNPLFHTLWYLNEYPDIIPKGMNPLVHYIQLGVAESTNPNPYFDTRWYLEEYPEVARSGMNPLLHFMRYGMVEGTNPSPYFDTLWYLNEYPHVGRSGMNPLVHFIRYGVKEGTNPSPYFDTRWYLGEYPGIAKSGINPLLHFLQYGVFEGKNPNPFFDTSWYLTEYPDVANSGMNPLLHYMQKGVAEKTNPNPCFNTFWYLSEYQDVALSDINPLVHFIRYGVVQGTNPNPYFDTRWYLNENPGVAECGINPLAHYMRQGVEEGTNPSPYFDTRWYLSVYPDVAHHGLNPLAHYLQRGINEERNPNPHFDTRWYLSQYPHVAESSITPMMHYITRGVAEGTNPNPFFHTTWYIEQYPDVAKSGVNPLKHFIENGIKEGRNPNCFFDTRCYLDKYCRWIWQFDTLSREDRRVMEQHIGKWQNPPVFSVVLPVYNPPPHFLDEAIWSVRNQLYPHWELCIADDASTDPEIKQLIERHAAADERIKVVYRQENGHISHASNSALELATGEYIALLDHDDLLSEQALFWVAEAVQRKPDVGLIYSDEDKLDSNGNRVDPYFKCDWNPFLFLGHNMICHLGVYRAALVREVGGFRIGYEGSQDYDLACRIIEKLRQDQILHIPRILYHWRIIPGSTAGDSGQKPYALVASERVVNEHLARQNLPGRVEGVPALGGMHRVKFALPENPPLVSILIPTRNSEQLVRQCIESIFAKTTYANYEIILIDNGSDSPSALECFAQLATHPQVRVLRDDGPFNFSRINNKGAAAAKGDILVLLNNDTEVVSPEWLDEMTALALLPKIGAVGAHLCYPDGTLQHGGVILGLGGCAAHAHSCLPREAPGYFGRARLLHMVSVVTGACLAVRTSLYQEVGGLDEENLKIGYNDVDFCLKLRSKGYWNVWTPHAELIHYESVSRGYEDTPEKKIRFFNEISILKKTWPNSFFHDPAYNPNLTFDAADFSLSRRPRIAGGSRRKDRLPPSLIAPITNKPRILIATDSLQSAQTIRFRAIADSLCRQGLIEEYGVADHLGFHPESSPSQGWFDAICLLGDGARIRWFHHGVMRCLPYLAVWSEESFSESFTQERNLEDVKQSLVHSAAVSVHSVHGLRHLERVTNLDLEFCTHIIPEGLNFPVPAQSPGKPKGLLWHDADLPFLIDSRDCVLRSLDAFSQKHNLPVYLVGDFPEEITENLKHHVRKKFADTSEYYDFLTAVGSLIGIVPADKDNLPDETLTPLKWKSDRIVAEYGGLGILGVYSAIPAILATDLRAGRVVENTAEAWREALEDLYTTGYLHEAENCRRIREQRSLDRLARQLWWPAIKKVLLDIPLPGSILLE